MLVSSCTFNRLGWEVTRVWTWTLLGLNKFTEADESASGWVSVGPYNSIEKKMEENRFTTLHSEADAFPRTCKLVKTYLAGTQRSGCLGGLDLLIVCLSGHPPLGWQAWGEAAASDQQMLQKIFYKLVSEASSTSDISLFHAGAHCTDTFAHPRQLLYHKELVLLLQVT